MTISWLTRPKMIRVARVAGYVAFGIVAFLVSVVLTFPNTRLKIFIENRLSTPAMKIRIDELSMRGLGSVALHGLTVILPPDKPVPNPSSDEPPPIPPAKELTLDRLDVSVGLFRLMFGGLAVSFTARNGDGVLGPVNIRSDKDKVTIDLAEIEAFPLPTGGIPLFGVQILGTLASGKGSLTYDKKEGLGASTGRLELTAEKVMIPRPTLSTDKQGGTVTLSDIDLGKVSLVMNLDKKSNIAALKGERRSGGADATILHIEKGEIDGLDAKAVIENRSQIRLFSGKSLKDGQMNVELIFGINEAFFNRKVMVGTEEQSPNRLLNLALSADPRWKAALNEGYWGVLCSGTLGSPKCDPKKSTVRGKEFKPPPKETETKVAGSEAARPTHRAETRPPIVAPAPTAVVVPTPEPSRPSSEHIPPPVAGKEAPSSPLPEAATAPVSVPGMTPTVIGRRLRVQALEGEGAGSAPSDNASPDRTKTKLHVPTEPEDEPAPEEE